MIGPKGSDAVWLKNGWTRTAHRLLGDRKSYVKVPCGLIFFDEKREEYKGEVVRWDNLDQQRIELCKVCWKGYTPQDSRTINELKWWDARQKLLTEIFTEAWIVISTPHHLEDFAHNEDGSLRTSGGNVVAQGTMLNYETLRSMLEIMLREETHRKVSRGRMKDLMRKLAQWERAHPYGEPIIDEAPELDVVDAEIVIDENPLARPQLNRA